jgi:hypothetical protein
VPTVAAARRIHQADILDLLAMIRPASMSRGEKVRVGNACDGGYVVPMQALECDVVLSIGVGSDVSFDLQLAERGAQVLQFDHTVAKVPSSHSNFRFHALGWGPKTEGSYLGFNEIVARLPAAKAHRLLLKFDIEGAEYDALDALSDHDLSRFGVIVCELHNLSQLPNPVFFDKVHRALTKLTLHHVPVHVHPNNYGAVVLLEGIPLPDVVEISFLRRDQDLFPGFSSDPIPGPLDRPNNPYLPDLNLTAFALTAASPVLNRKRL